jgi:UDP-4-amino-4,6-dideoxy-N-acetyl-beta-L-altrosamine transaminase
MIPYGRQDIQDEDIAAVVAVLQSDWLTQGPAIERFEAAVAHATGAAYAVAVSNATAALHLACLASDIGPGDRVWTVPNTFVASANCARYCGAQIDFVDIDPQTYNLSIPALQHKLEQARHDGQLPRLLIPVHFAGQSCDMAAIHALSQTYGFQVLEDASHAIGASYDQQPVGNCRYSRACVFSFHPVKIVTTGEGGVVTTNDADMYERLLRLRSHGITRNPSMMQGASHGPWYYQQIELGYNYRMTDMQAALGASQMQRLQTYIARRRELAASYDRLLADLPLRLPSQHPDTASSWHLYVVQVAHAEIRRPVFEHLRAAGIGVNVHYIPVHCQPDYTALGFYHGQYPVAEAYYERAISIPLYAGLSDQDQHRVIAAIRDACTAAGTHHG